MKFLSLLGLTLVVVSCKSASSGTNDPPEKEIRISAEDHTVLIREKLEAEKELALVLANSEVEDDKLEVARQELAEAYLDLQALQSELPVLQDLSEKIRDRHSRLQHLRAGGNDSKVQMAAAEIATLQQTLAELGKEQPEVREAQQKVDRANGKLAETRRELVRDLPEAKELIEKLDVLNRKLVEISH